MRRAGAVTASITAIGASLSQAAARGRPVVHEIAPCDPMIQSIMCPGCARGVTPESRSDLTANL